MYRPAPGLGATDLPPESKYAPTRKDLQDDFDHYKRSFPAGNAPGKDPAAAKQWSEDYLRKYARDNGIPTTESDVKAIASSELTKELDRNGIPIDRLPQNKQELVDALREGAAAYVTAQTGIDPKLTEVTIEALSDGKLSDDEMRAIGSTAGAIAGAAVCQAFGIPAPIGAFFGREFGGMVGATVSQVFGIAPTPGDIERAAEAAFEAQQRALREREEKACRKYQEDVYVYVRQTITSLESQWENIERAVGTGFELRWFAPAFKPPPRSLPAAAYRAGYVTPSAEQRAWLQKYDASFCEQRGTPPGKTVDQFGRLCAIQCDPRITPKCLSSLNHYPAWQCNDRQGCKYPPPLPLPTNSGILTFGPFPQKELRVVSALLVNDPNAYDRLVLGSAWGDSCNLPMPGPNVTRYNPQAVENWQRLINWRIPMTNAVPFFRAAATSTLGDIIKTGATVKAERDVVAETRKRTAHASTARGDDAAKAAMVLMLAAAAAAGIVVVRRS
jgi:hypothetical protein